MELSRIGEKTILDGKGTLLITKNNHAISIQGFENKPLAVQHMHIIGGTSGKIKQLLGTANFIYSDEIKTTKKVSIRILGGLIGIGASVVLSFLSNKV